MTAAKRIEQVAAALAGARGLEAELRSALRAMATDVRFSESHLGQLIEHLKRLLVACAKQSSADPGAIPSMVARSLGHAEFDRLWRDINERELRELVVGEVEAN